MFILIGFLIVFFSVFGSFVALGGHLGVLYQPFEFVLIAGAALGAYIASSSGKSVKLLLDSLPIIAKKSPYSKELYMELMALLYEILDKTRKEGLLAIERDMRVRPFGILAAVDDDGTPQIKALMDGDAVLFQEPLY